jgi:hypothetical protein
MWQCRSSLWAAVAKVSSRSCASDANDNLRSRVARGIEIVVLLQLHAKIITGRNKDLDSSILQPISVFSRELRSHHPWCQ